MAEENGGKRYKANMQGLLSFCTEYTKTEDAPAMSVMSDERKEWLREALEGMTSNDPVKKMIEALQCLGKSGGSGGGENGGDESGGGGSGGGESGGGGKEEDINKDDNAQMKEDEENKEIAMENMIMYCEDLDLANDFYNIGGFQTLPALLQDPHPPIQVSTAHLIATIAQNNPFIQQKLVDHPTIIPHLITMVGGEVERPELRVKCLYALSCITREFHIGQDRFNDLGGFKVIKKIIGVSEVNKLKVKALFLLGALCVERDANKEIIINHGMVEDIVGVLRQNNHKNSQNSDKTLTEMSEMSLRALHGLVGGHYDRCIVECLRVEGFKGVMEGCLRRWKGNKDQVAVIKEIMSCCML